MISPKRIDGLQIARASLGLAEVRGAPLRVVSDDGGQVVEVLVVVPGLRRTATDEPRQQDPCPVCSYARVGIIAAGLPGGERRNVRSTNYERTICDGVRALPAVAVMAILALLTSMFLVGCPIDEDPNQTPSDDDDTVDDDDDDVIDDDDDDSESGLSAQYHPTWPDVPPVEHEDTIDPPPGATENDDTVPTDIASSVEFIYSGDDASQFGVAEDTIEDYRVSVVRGRVLQTDGTGLPDVEITVLGHEELGYTFSRADGGFDLVVNGGGVMTIQYDLAGYLTSQRKVNVPWRDFTWTPDIVLLEPDTEVTEIDLLSATAIQVARGSVVTDESGERQATMMFPPQMSAVMTLSDGTEEPLETLNVRATEYTVRDYAYDSMPGNLPATSAYTYAVELSIDEALAAGARQVTFDTPVPYYLDNFIGFPVGVTVPAGYYDSEQGMWIAARSGVIIEILDTTGGYAEIDVDGSGLAADSMALDELGITEEELEEIANLYAVGDTVWRVPLDHFTPWDLNMAATPPDNAIPPDGSGPDDNDIEGDVCHEDGSIIECQNQILGESVPITGTSFSLDYRSHRTPGWKVGQALQIRVAGEEVPETLKRIEVEIQIGGRRWEYTLSHCPDQVFTFDEWNGLDAFGRPMQGQVPVQVTVGYAYQMVYQEVSTFGEPAGDTVISYNYDWDGYNTGGVVTGDCDEEEPLPPSAVWMMAPYDPFSLEWRTSATTVNGDTYADTFDAASQLWTSTTPEGRETLVYVDDLDRPIEVDIDPAVAPVTIT